MRRLGIVAVGLALVVGVLVVLLASEPERAAGVGDPGMEIVGPVAPVPVTETFDANIAIYSTTPFMGYGVEVDVPGGLSFVSGMHHGGSFPSCSGWVQFLGWDQQCGRPDFTEATA